MDTAVPQVVQEYFDASARRDVESVVGLFAEDAAVVDESETRRGRSEIRAWQEGPASRYEYTTELRRVEPAGTDAFLVSGRIEGNFPGGTADLTWRFTLAGDRIRQLEIAP
ncbi:nuclear transport factor 2 family protein [Micromonospora sp. NPDC050187]|uniref:nuclear transport factor 2 family protein n=1 Tax=Micromonospora sp. NPDC050187 TaxID=3364277 RepID=UPI0037ADA3BE